MNGEFPIPIPDRLPIKIDPCPIAEAILEIRFVTSESWPTLPGLLFGRIRDRYPEQKGLPLAQLPEEIRRRESAFTYQPLIQFLGRDFLIQFGPRVVSLVTKSKQYPGWAALEEEMTWLVSELQQTGFVSEGERLGVRYINFFSFDIFEKLEFEVSTGKKRLAGELSVTSVLTKPPLTSRLLVANSAILGTGDSARHGSILDVDVWLGSLDFDLFQNGLAPFSALLFRRMGRRFGPAIIAARVGGVLPVFRVCKISGRLSAECVLDRRRMYRSLLGGLFRKGRAGGVQTCGN